MDDRLDQLLAKQDALLEAVSKLVTAFESYRELLPDPGSVKAKIAKRRIGAAMISGALNDGG